MRAVKRNGNDIINTRTYQDWLDRLTMIASTCREWINLPETCDERKLELQLLNGYSTFFYDPVLGYLNLHGVEGTRRDNYGNPVEMEVIGEGTTIYRNVVKKGEFVNIYDNNLRISIMPTIELYARRLYEVERTIEVNVKAQKTPVAILCTEQQRLTFKNLYNQYDGNQPFIFGDKDLDMSAISSIKTDAHYISGELFILKHNYINEFLTIMGIENGSQDKKERLIAREVEANFGSVAMNRNIRLAEVERGVREINRVFGLDIKVNFRSDLPFTADYGKILEHNETIDSTRAGDTM